MNNYGYASYEEYLNETGKRGKPKTAERHREKLNKKLDTLYSQGDYRALEVITGLADELMKNEDEERYSDLWLTVLHLLDADNERIRFCRIFSL